MSKYVLGVFVLLILWIAALVLGLPLWLPLSLTLVVAAVVATVLGVRALLSRRRASKLEEALGKAAQVDPSNTRPDLLAEIEHMTGEFHKAIAALKTSRLRGGGRNALHALPWYVLIGPPGTGKSTALRSSGLEFPYSPSALSSASIAGVGGTRNCDWWFSNEAILLDTAGRWTTQDDDTEWFAFMDLLRKHRRGRPLNGVIVTVGVDELMSAGSETVASLAKRVRDRVDEVMRRLNTTLPVYVFITKADKIPGFAETFADLPKSERDKAWGFTAPLSLRSESRQAYFASELGALRSALEERVLARMGEQRRPDQRGLAFTFPAHFSEVANHLEAFLVHLFEGNVYQDAPRFRGAYFTSGTQEGEPVAQLTHRMAQLLGITLPPGSALTSMGTPKSYFLREVFSKVIFPDAAIAGPNERSTRVSWIVQLATAVTASCGAILLVSLSTYAWWHNKELVSSIDTLMRPLVGHREVLAARAVQPLAMEPLLHRTSELRTRAQQGVPLVEDLGMDPSPELYEPVRAFYVWVVRDQLVGQVVRDDERMLSTFGEHFQTEIDDQPTGPRFRAYCQLLADYLSVTSPRASNQPALTAASANDLSRRFAQRWASRGVNENDPAIGSTQGHVRFFLSLMGEDLALAFPRNDRVVRTTRTVLNRHNVTDQVLDALDAQVAGRGYDLSLQRIVGNTGGALQSDGRVRGIFTRQAWEEVVRGRIALAAQSAGPDWVLSDTASTGVDSEQAALVVAELSSAYFERFVAEWQEFLRTVRVVPPENDARSLTLLQDLTRGNPPALGRFLARLRHETDLRYPTLEPPSEGEDLPDSVIDRIRRGLRGTPVGQADASTATHGLGETGTQSEVGRNLLTARDVAEAFDSLTAFGVAPPVPPGDEGNGEPPPVALDVYHEQLAYVRDALQAYRDNPETSVNLMDRLQDARTRVEALISEQPPGWRSRLSAWLRPPIEGASLSSTRAVAASTERAWCQDIAGLFDRTLNGRYPFDRHGEDVPLADFVRFYKPQGGALWSFYEESLAAQIPRQGDRFGFATRLGRGADSVYRDDLSAFLTRSQQLSRGFFAPGSEEARVEFDVRIHPTPTVALTTLSIGGVQIEYRNSPERWTRFVWPGQSPAEGAVLAVRGQNGMHERLEQEGEWGFFRLLERGALQPSSDDRLFTITWRLQGHDAQVVVDFRTTRRDSPFVAGGRRPRLLHVLRASDASVPGSIAHGGSSCRTDS